MKILIVDDESYRHNAFDKWLTGHEIEHCYTVDNAVKALARKTFDLICLDHDLGDSDGRTGVFLARLICGLPTPLWPRQVVVHSWNKAGAKQMTKLFDVSGIPVFTEEFSYQLVRRLATSLARQ